MRNPARLSRATAGVGRCVNSWRERRVVLREASAGKLGERQGPAAVHGHAVGAGTRHTEERGARHAEPARDARDEEVRELGEGARRRQLAQQREEAVAVARVVAVLEPPERRREAAPHGHEAERHQEARGRLERAPRVRHRERERVREEHLGEREEARADEQRAHHGGRLAAEDLDVPQPVARESREERGGHERERQERERREDRNGAAEEARHEVQDDERKDPDGRPEEQEPHLLLREEVARAPREDHESEGREGGARRHPRDLRAVERRHGGRGVSGGPEVRARRRREKDEGRQERERAPGRAGPGAGT